MQRPIHSLFASGLFLMLAITSCVPALKVREARKGTPGTYAGSADTTNSASLPRALFIADPDLRALIDTALANNQELSILLQEVEVLRNEARARKAEYLPFVGLGLGADVEKVGEFTRNGAVEHNLDVKEGTHFPEPLSNYGAGLRASWELDVWKRLRNARKAATLRYLGGMEGRNFMVTNLVAEIANSYYELLALDNQLEILQANIAIQQDALEVVKLQKQAAKVTELAVRRFEAEVLKNRSALFDVQQRITQTENRINFLVGRYPQPVQRRRDAFAGISPVALQSGLPAQLLTNRPDIRQAELELEAAKLDVKAARASFYPSVGIRAGVGFNAFDPMLLLESPASLMYGLAGDLVTPLVNRNAIKAQYASATARQLQAVHAYERTLLNAYVEVANELSNINNLEASYDLRRQQVDVLSSSITISNNLFRSARADYMEVLLTQREALESKVELVETRKRQMNAMVDMYRALGGGWR
ncbi:MAG TPA: TolC family protein [Flavobacteriales bacterium]|nr:TolC family protein [Flavobacteriales bacterium]HMR27681.1 TolC family protein [Flavobacteriales bacterium]